MGRAMREVHVKQGWHRGGGCLGPQARVGQGMPRLGRLPALPAGGALVGGPSLLHDTPLTSAEVPGEWQVS